MCVCTTEKVKGIGVVVGCVMRKNGSIESTVRMCINEAIKDMEQNAYRIGATSVVGMRITQTMDKDTICVTAIGTAVK